MTIRLEYVIMDGPSANCRIDSGKPHVWHNSFAVLTHDPEGPACMTRYCRDCGVTFSSYNAQGAS